MPGDLESWKTQVRKGYLELCVLLFIQKHRRIYGFDLIERLGAIGLPLKEGTLYPVLNRMTADKILQAVWETENAKGHPRKFYSLTREGARILEDMKAEFESMVAIFKAAQK